MCVIIAAVALPGSGAGSRRGGRREPARVAHMERLGWGRGGNIFLLLCNKQFVGVNRSWGGCVVSGFRPLLNVLEICHPCWWEVPFLPCVCGLYAQPRSNIELESERERGGTVHWAGPWNCAVLNLCRVLKTGWNWMLTSAYGPEEVKYFLKGLRFRHFLAYATIIWALLVPCDFSVF